MINMNVLDYRITNDDRQLILKKARRDESNRLIIKQENGVEIESTSQIGYYGNLKQVLRAIKRDYAMSDVVEIQTIADFEKAVHDVLKAFESQIELKGVDFDD